MSVNTGKSQEEDLLDFTLASTSSTDLGQYLDLPESPSFALGDSVPFTSTSASGYDCPSHPGQATCDCRDFLEAWSLPEPVITSHSAVEEPDYTRFEDWIPLHVRPEKPCDYCRSRRLDCYKQRGEPSCTPCLSLFRECSLAVTQHAHDDSNHPTAHSGALLDTLHVVDENTAIERGALTGIKPLISKGRSSGTTTPNHDEEPGSSKRNGIRFPRHAIKLLRDWLDQHADYPYPNEDEKAELERQTDLKPSQIGNWLANARRRRKATDKNRPKVAGSPSLKHTPAMPIPKADLPREIWTEMNPLDRWKHSPPENEPASITDIAYAVATTNLPAEDVAASPSSKSSKRRQKSSNGSLLSKSRVAPSTTSLDTSKISSSLSTGSARFSQGSSHSHGSFGSFSSGLGGKKDRKRRRRPAPSIPRTSINDGKRIFQCTFCTDTFKSKYDWTRHEKSLHISLEKWICAPLGPIIIDQESGKKICVYCNVEDPSDDHIESHRYRQCEEKGLDARTFYRKDHLRQHLRLMHGCEVIPSMDSWKAVASNINSRCGFCSQRFTVWQERIDHLTAHFKAGARMSEWKGCRGLDPAVAAQVTNAMPPYLIGMETVSPNPFSASNKASWNHLQPFESAEGIKPEDCFNLLSGDLIDDREAAPCWEVLTVRLGAFANEQAHLGVVLTDEMLQAEARRILYGDDDGWEQTAADNPEWLDLFKKAHGLDFIPSTIGGQGLSVPEDLETYGDLGLRIPFAVQLKAYNEHQIGNNVSMRDAVGPYQQAIQMRQEELKKIFAELSRKGVLQNEDHDCGHAVCKTNIIDLDVIGQSSTSGSRSRRWCSYKVPPGNKDLFDRIKLIESPDRASDSRRSKDLSMNELLSARQPRDQRHDARNRGVETGSGVETSAVSYPPKDRPGYLMRYKLELPKHRASLFATTTPAWDDPGQMPAAVSTLASPPSIYEQSTTSTGAMMEFLGGQNGGHLPFSGDNLTSTIPLPTTSSMFSDPTNIPVDMNDYNFTLDDTTMRDLEAIVAATTASDPQPSVAPTTTEMANPPDWLTYNYDVAMNETTFDDLDYLGDTDGVFDMQIDETLLDYNGGQ